MFRPIHVTIILLLGRGLPFTKSGYHILLLLFQNSGITIVELKTKHNIKIFLLCPWLSSAIQYTLCRWRKASYFNVCSSVVDANLCNCYSWGKLSTWFLL